MTQLRRPKRPLTRHEKAFLDWVHKNMVSGYGRMAEGHFESFEQWVSQCGYFGTFMFARRALDREKERRGLTRSNPTLEWDAFHGGYKAVTKLLIGKRYENTRNWRLWPLAIVGLDFEGSKYIGSGDFLNENIHFHAGWVVHPTHAAEFRELVESGEVERTFRRYGSFDSVKFESLREPVGTYGIKSLVKTQADPQSFELARVYPNSDPLDRRIQHRSILNYRAPTSHLRKVLAGIRRERIMDLEYEAELRGYR